MRIVETESRLTVAVTLCMAEAIATTVAKVSIFMMKDL